MKRVHVVLLTLFVGSAVIRVAAGLQRSTPLYYPDEYIYSGLARAIAGSGLPDLRGAFQVPSLLVPYFMAPFWLVDGVGRAYHLVVAAGGIAFSTAVFPAYALARRIGISQNGGLFVALLTALVPDAAFTTCALTESYAYPLFLVVVVVAVDSIVSPTRRRQGLAFALMVALCLVRLQFLVFPVAYLVALVIRERLSWRRAWRHPAILGAAVLVLAGGVAATHGFYSALSRQSGSIWSIGPWITPELFGIALALGWALVPGAVVGLGQLVKSEDAWRHTFGVLTISTIVLLVFEAAYYDAILPRVHERYTFYAVPLLAAACVYAFRSMRQQFAYSVAAYTLAAVAIVLPATATFHNSDASQAPALLPLTEIGSDGAAQLAWAIPLCLVAMGLGLFRNLRTAPLVLGAVIAAGLGFAGTRALLDRTPPIAHPGGVRNTELYELGSPADSALVTWRGTDRYVLMKTLFWTPSAERVLVVGGGPAADGFGSEPVTFGARGFLDSTGRPVQGPFAFDVQTTVLSGDGPSLSSRWLRRAPEAIVFGRNRATGELGTTSVLLVAPASRSRILSIAFRSDIGGRRLTFNCPSRRFRVTVNRGSAPVRVTIPPGGGVSRCRISLTRGSAVEQDGSIVSGVRMERLAWVASNSQS